MQNPAQKIDQVRLGQSVETLRRIAAALGLPESAFYDTAEAGSAFDAIGELLRIWDSLEHAADRQRLLAFARTLSPRD